LSIELSVGINVAKKLDKIAQNFYNNDEYDKGILIINSIFDMLAKNNWTKEIATKDPEFLGWLYNQKGAFFHMKGEYIKAIRCYNTANKLISTGSIPLNNKGLLYFTLRDFKKAKICYNKALIIDPDSIEALNGKAESLANLENHRQAIIGYKKSLSLDSNQSQIWANLATSLYFEKKFIEAKTAVDESLRLKPNFEFAITISEMIDRKLLPQS